MRDCYYQKHALPCEKTATQSLLLSSLRVWSMDSCLRSPALSQVYLSLTFQLWQTAVVKVEMSSTFPTVPVKHRMDKRKSFVIARQYRNCFSRRINAPVPRNQPIKTSVGIVMHDFPGLKTMTFHPVADIAYF